MSFCGQVACQLRAVRPNRRATHSRQLAAFVRVELFANYHPSDTLHQRIHDIVVDCRQVYSV